MRPRQLVLVTGDPASTARAVADALAELPPTRVAWIAPEPLVPELPYVALSPRQLPRALGRSFDVVVLDGHGGGIEADALGQAHGLVLGGGALVLRVDSENTPLDPEARARLAASPYTGAEVGQRFQTHLRRTLARFATPLPDRFTPADRPDRGSAEQAAVVAAIVDAWVRAPGQAQVLTADRGRGKSSALGLALAELARSPNAAYRARLVTGPSEAAVAELLRFANRDDPRTARFVPLLELLAAPVATQPGEPGPILIVDEAAQLPVPLLQRLVLAHPAASFAFATTTHGYEGTGRGFTLRFLNWLRARGPVIEHGLTAPIRWAGDDPVEAAVFAALLLDAEPAAGPFPAADDPDAEPRFERLDRDALIADAAGLRRLRELFGLLIHAHYRTTPGDLERLLDAPNLEVHAALLGDPDGDRVVAANLVAREGALPPPLTADAAAGKTRLRAHALADVLVAHLGHPEAGALAMRRSVRLATHPALRRRGLARALVEHTHALAAREDQPPELFGTLFGATPELVAFRRALGYRLVRVSAARGARTGEPSLLMLRPLSVRGEALVALLELELARELEVQLALLAADDGLDLDPALIAALREGLPEAPPYTAEQQRVLTAAYARSPRTFESAATAIRGWLRKHPGSLDRLDRRHRAIVEGRVLQLRGWREVAATAGVTTPAAMRALRRAIRELLVE